MACLKICRIGQDHFTPQRIAELRELSLFEIMQELHVPRWKVPILLFRGRRMITKHLHGIAVHNGMADVIKKLHAQGVPLYVLSSNSTTNVQSYLEWHKLSDSFTGVYGGASLLGKAPRLLKLVDKEHIDIANTWYVGDETRDVSAARAVGFKIVSVSWGYNTRTALEAKQPDALVDTAKELLAILETAWKK